MKKLKVVSDTLFKQSPSLSSELTKQQKEFVKNGTEFELKTSEVARGSHLKVTLAQPLGAAKRDVWYIYKPDVRVYDTKIKLTVLSSTLFKQRPVLSSQLGEREKVFVANGTEFYLQSYLPAEGQHVKVAIANDFLGPENRTVWYAYKPDIRILGDTITLTVTSDTLFKTSPQLSSQLSNSDKVFVRNTTELELVSHELARSNHDKLALAAPSYSNRPERIWYAYKPHAPHLADPTSSCQVFEATFTYQIRLFPVVTLPGERRPTAAAAFQSVAMWSMASSALPASWRKSATGWGIDPSQLTPGTATP